MTITNRPYQYCWSKNEIAFSFLLTDLSATGLYGQIRIFYALPGVSTFTDMGQVFELVPDSEGTITLPVQQYIDALLKYILPDIRETITVADKQAIKFYISYRQITDDDPDADWTNDDDNTILALKGGIEKNKWLGNNYFVNYQEAGKYFLTWHPNNSFVFANENVFLTFWNLLPADANYTLKVIKYCTDATTVTVTTSFYASSTLYHFFINPDVFDFSDPTGKILYYYTAQVFDNTDTAISELRTFYIEKRPVYVFYELLFHNSLGGFQNLRTISDINLTYDRALIESENNTGIIHTSILLRKKYKGDAGYKREKERQLSLMELLASKNVFMLIDRMYCRVVNLQDSQDTGTEKDKKFNFLLEWSLSESNEVFTPANKIFNYLGTGAYPLSFVVASVTEADGGGDYDAILTWDPADPLPTDYTIKLVNVTNDITILFEHIGTTNTYTIPVNTAIDYLISIKSNYPTTSSAYSPTITL